MRIVEKRRFSLGKRGRGIGRGCFFVLLALVCIGIVWQGIDLGNNIATWVAGKDSWGLSFPEEGKQPRGNADKETLLRNNAYFVGGETDKVIYLTFDAGYENGFTPGILDTLKKHEICAAFFLVGHYMEQEPDLVKRMEEEGHIVANHTYTHPNMASISTKEKLAEELERNETVCAEKTGVTMRKYYRPPGGKYSEENLQHARELGYSTIFWSLAYVDWHMEKQPTREEALAKLVSRAHPGMVLLLHSASQINMEILDELITTYKDMGYTFGTLDDLVDGGAEGPEGAGNTLAGK
ncbi:polysaccharide deacetylase family protein [Eubacteriales bacterium OttesenSCG-928-M02]|nr:polysaccharide deacetylase family protein [Eubacteriales bacterium OttesenSCG-928-M02]